MLENYHTNIVKNYSKNIINFKNKINGSYHTYKKKKMVKKNDKKERIERNDSN